MATHTSNEPVCDEYAHPVEKAFGGGHQRAQEPGQQKKHDNDSERIGARAERMDLLSGLETHFSFPCVWWKGISLSMDKVLKEFRQDHKTMVKHIEDLRKMRAYLMDLMDLMDEGMTRDSISWEEFNQFCAN